MRDDTTPEKATEDAEETPTEEETQEVVEEAQAEENVAAEGTETAEEAEAEDAKTEETGAEETGAESAEATEEAEATQDTAQSADEGDPALETTAEPIPEDKPSETLGYISFIFGGVSILISCFYTISLVIGAAGILFSIFTLVRVHQGKSRGKGYAIAGLVMSILGFGSSVVALLFDVSVWTMIDIDLSWLTGEE